MLICVVLRYLIIVTNNEVRKHCSMFFLSLFIRLYSECFILSMACVYDICKLTYVPPELILYFFLLVSHTANTVKGENVKNKQLIV